MRNGEILCSLLASESCPVFENRQIEMEWMGSWNCVAVVRRQCLHRRRRLILVFRRICVCTYRTLPSEPFIIIITTSPDSSTIKLFCALTSIPRRTSAFFCCSGSPTFSRYGEEISMDFIACGFWYSTIKNQLISPRWIGMHTASECGVTDKMKSNRSMRMIRHALSVYFQTFIGFDSLSFSTCTENIERIRVENAI